MNLITHTLFLSIVLILNGCAMQHNVEQKQVKNKVTNVSIHTYTRGMSKTIAIDSIEIGKYTYDEKVASHPVSADVWDKTRSMVQNIDLTTLNELTVPSHGHASDRNLAENLTITTYAEVYKTPTYDAANPPKEIKELVNYIKQLKP